MPAIVRMSDLGQETAWQDLPRLQRWYEAIRAHPAFEPTYYPGSLLTERFPHALVSCSFTWRNGFSNQCLR
jgi:glutathione S-transferase